MSINETIVEDAAVAFCWHDICSVTFHPGSDRCPVRSRIRAHCSIKQSHPRRKNHPDRLSRGSINLLSPQDSVLHHVAVLASLATWKK